MPEGPSVPVILRPQWSGGGTSSKGRAGAASWSRTRGRNGAVLFFHGGTPGTGSLYGPNEKLDWLAGMAAAAREEFAAGEAGERQLQAFIERLAPSLTEIDAGPPSAALAGLLGPVDRSLLSGGYARHGGIVMRAALQHGIWGWLDDDLALLAEWGFELASIEVPVAIWHGDDDRMVPFAHGRWLAERVPGAGAHLLPGEGHLSIEVSRYGEVLDDLLARGQRIGSGP